MPNLSKIYGIYIFKKVFKLLSKSTGGFKDSVWEASAVIVLKKSEHFAKSMPGKICWIIHAKDKNKK